MHDMSSEWTLNYSIRLLRWNCFMLLSLLPCHRQLQEERYVPHLVHGEKYKFDILPRVVSWICILIWGQFITFEENPAMKHVSDSLALVCCWIIA